MIGVSNHLLTIVFRFHYHSQEMIGSLGIFFGGFLLGFKKYMNIDSGSRKTPLFSKNAGIPFG